MNQKRLILVEGIPGSGKSTFARKIADYYRERGRPVNLYNEGDYHPADLAWQASVPVSDLDGIHCRYPALKEEIEQNTHLEGDTAIIPYTHIKVELSPASYNELESFYQDMESYTCYNNRIPFDEFKNLFYSRWDDFGFAAESTDAINIFECAFLQNHVTELMNYRLKDLDAMIHHQNRLLEGVAALSPMLIYLSQPSVDTTIRRVAKERKDPDRNWIDMVIQLVEESPLGIRLGLKGIEGVIYAYEKRKQAELEIIKTLPIPVYTIENPYYDWEAVWQEIERVLP